MNGEASPEDIAAMRAALTDANDEQLGKFLKAYTLGAIASWLIAQMPPAARIGFFISMRAHYPEARVHAPTETADGGSN